MVKTYNLGNNISEIECAKLYNQQALYMGTEYKLNDIPDYITMEKDIYTSPKPSFSSVRYKEIQDKMACIVSSKYHCVTLTKNNTWRSYYTLNGKKNNIGTFKTEIEACKAYNEKVIELNKKGFNYKLNDI